MPVGGLTKNSYLQETTNQQENLKMMDNLPQRLSYDKLVGGVLGGISRQFGIEAKALRILYGIGLLIGPFQLKLFVLYLVLWAILPQQKIFNDHE